MVMVASLFSCTYFLISSKVISYIKYIWQIYSPNLCTIVKLNWFEKRWDPLKFWICNLLLNNFSCCLFLLKKVLMDPFRREREDRENALWVDSVQPFIQRSNIFRGNIPTLHVPQTLHLSTVPNKKLGTLFGETGCRP